MFVFGQSCCIRAKVAISFKMIVFWQSGFTREKAAVFEQKLLYSGKCCCIWAKVVVFGQSGCTQESGSIGTKVVVIVQSRSVREKVVVFGQSC